MIPICEKFDSRNIHSKLSELSSHYPHMHTFAFLLYDSKDYLLHKILRDDDYWHSLNEISGQYIHIFYFDVPENRRRVERQKYEQRHLEQQNSMPKVCQMMIATPAPDRIDEAVNMLHILFQEKIRCPAILFFQVENRSIVNHFVINIKGKEVEQAFLELHSIITQASDFLAKSSVDSKSDSSYFSFLEDKIKASRFFRLLKNHFSFSLGPFSCKL